MALNAYLSLKGKKTGDFKGSVIQKGKEGKILVIAASHKLSVPIDSASGLATGRRLHGPFVITKELDQSSPLFYNALVTNESITEWRLEFWGEQLPSGTGKEIQKYTVQLKNARITNIQFVMPNVKDPDLVKYTEYEEISFVYESIEWIWTDGNVTAADTLKTI